MEVFVPTRITITVGNLTLNAELNDSPTARKIASALPFSVSFQTWGDEFYFEIPVADGPSDDARAEMEVGEIGYWPPGQAMCLFFGPTPASTGDAPVAASPVNPIGRILGDATRLKEVDREDAIHVELV
jgi:hypothetical protein